MILKSQTIISMVNKKACVYAAYRYTLLMNNVYCSFGLAHNCLNGNTGKFTLNVFTILDCQKDILLYYGANVNNNHK